MTRERQIESPTHAVAVNGRIDGFGEMRDGIHQFLTHAGECDGGRSGERPNLREICPRGEKPGIASDDERFGSAFEAAQSFDDIEHAGSSQAIGLVGRDQLEPAKSPKIVDLQVGRHERFAFSGTQAGRVRRSSALASGIPGARSAGLSDGGLSEPATILWVRQRPGKSPRHAAWEHCDR